MEAVVTPHKNRFAEAPIVIDRVQGFALSVRPPVGPVSSLGNMPTRNGVLVAITSKEGVTGWGEIWCNFPPRGNLARLNLLQDVIAPLLLNRSFTTYAACRPYLEGAAARMAIHTGEFGPFAHCFAGIDTAMADLAARSVNLSLSEFLSDAPARKVPVYASTPNVSDLETAIGDITAAGHTGVKLKIGLGKDIDVALLRNVDALTQGRLRICADANQNWTVERAIETMTALSDHAIDFIEEPLRADALMTDWARLADALDVPLAGGENITSAQAFVNFMDHGKMRIIQPDVAKWGGVSGAMEVGQCAAERGAMCAIHYMGTGLGLAASLHTLAAIGGTGPIELDSNPNPLRTDLGQIDLSVTDGMLNIVRGPGHGFTPDPAALGALSIASFSTS